jgi:transposase
MSFDLLFGRVAGLDVHKSSVVACRLVVTAEGRVESLTRKFGTTTPELLRLSDWLSEAEVTHVGMESTGVYWKPIYNLLEGPFTVWIFNAASVKNVPGRKTDVNDAQWLAELLRHGLVRPSYIPAREQRDLRDLTRERTNFVRQRATLSNRLQKVLEDANLKLGDVASNVLGVSGRAILAALIEGERDPAVLAELAKGRLRSKREELRAALAGRVRAHHCFLLEQVLTQIDNLQETIEAFDREIAAACAPQAAALELLQGIAGVGEETAQAIVAEVGTDMSHWASAGHLAAWAGLAPGNNESAGKRRSGKTRRGNPWLRSALVQAAWAAVRTKGSYFGAQFRRIERRRGRKRAILAVAHSLLVVIYYMLKRQEAYRELGADYFEQRAPEARAKRLVRQVEKLGYTVTAPPQPATA